MQNYAYLRPSTRMLKTNSLESQISGNGQRILFGQPNRQLTSQQAQALTNLKDYFKRKNPNREISQEVLLRYFHLGNRHIIGSLGKFKYYDEWWSMPQIPKNKEKGILHSGVFYCYGRDDAYSPNIYFQPSQISLNAYTIEDYLISLRTLLAPIEENMLVPGRIERWNVVVDVRTYNDSKVGDNHSIYVNNLMKICYAYPYRLKRLFLVAGGGYNGLWTKVSSTFRSSNSETESIVRQLGLSDKLIKIVNLRDLDRYIPIQQRQRKYGGSLDDLSQFWPISSTNRLMQVNSRFVQGSQQSQSYVSIANEQNAQFFGQKQQTPRCKCSIQ